MDQVLEILETCPSLIPNVGLKIWIGTILFEGEEIPVTISTPHFPSLKGFSLMCPTNMKQDLQQRLERFKEDNLNDDLLQLLRFLRGKEIAVGQDKNPVVQLDYYLYNHVLNELHQLRGEDLVACSGDLQAVTLRTVDGRGVEHRLVAGLSPDYPSCRPTVLDADLPEIALPELNQAETILEMFKIFQSLVDSFQDFWNMYDSLTRNTWVIDPEHPSHKDTRCRITIGENVSMLITLNPQDANTCPDIKFLGPENAIIPFINSMEKKLKTVGWDEDDSILDNLLSLLDLSCFPQPDLQSDSVPQQGECSICFLVRLEDQALPTKICNNTKCNSYFHINCLAQWFQAVPTNETSFNLISGDCPCCGERILCPIKVN